MCMYTMLYLMKFTNVVCRDSSRLLARGVVFSCVAISWKDNFPYQHYIPRLFPVFTKTKHHRRACMKSYQALEHTASCYLHRKLLKYIDLFWSQVLSCDLVRKTWARDSRVHSGCPKTHDTITVLTRRSNCDCGYPHQILSHLMKYPLVLPVDIDGLNYANARAVQHPSYERNLSSGGTALRPN